MATVFCSHCGYLIARGENVDMEQAVQDSRLSACPGCGSTEGIGWSPSDLSQEELRQAMRAERIGGLGEREDLSDLVNERMHGAVRRRAKTWLVRVGLIMLIVGLIAGGVAFYFTRQWAQSAMLGGAAGFAAAWLIDTVAPSLLK